MLDHDLDGGQVQRFVPERPDHDRAASNAMPERRRNPFAVTRYPEQRDSHRREPGSPGHAT
ncbi:MAG TPA: hypothetical protein VMU94_29375, partial [Streptosporangiaceae bacterium]|nr:hypothetical protein [Streptosporangiaceae bacterium]